jgi:hypothetical protein
MAGALADGALAALLALAAADGVALELAGAAAGWAALPLEVVGADGWFG